MCTAGAWKLHSFVAYSIITHVTTSSFTPYSYSGCGCICFPRACPWYIGNMEWCRVNIIISAYTAELVIVKASCVNGCLYM